MTANLAGPSYVYEVVPSPEVCRLSGIPDSTAAWTKATENLQGLWGRAFPEVEGRFFDEIYGGYPLALIFTARLAGRLAGAMQVGLPRPGAKTPGESGSLHVNAVTTGTPVWGRLEEYPNAIAELPLNWGLTPDVHINVVDEALRGVESPNPSMLQWLARTAFALFHIGEESGLTKAREVPGIITSFVGRYLEYIKCTSGDGLVILGPPSRYGGNENNGIPDNTWTTLAALRGQRNPVNDWLAALLNARNPGVDKVVQEQQPILEAIYRKQQ